jgi:hypothetical protein
MQRRGVAVVAIEKRVRPGSERGHRVARMVGSCSPRRALSALHALLKAIINTSFKSRVIRCLYEIIASHQWLYRARFGHGLHRGYVCLPTHLPSQWQP